MAESQPAVIDSRRRRPAILSVLVTAGVLAAIVLAVLGSKGMLSGNNKADKAATSLSERSSPAVQTASSHENREKSNSTPALADSGTPLHDAQDTESQLEHKEDSQTQDKQVTEADVCRVANAAELKDAVESRLCETIQLTSMVPNAYYITNEILIRRHVSIIGSPLTMPVIDANGASRAFRVAAEGYLELKYVQLIPSEKDVHGPSRRKRHAQARAGSDANNDHRQADVEDEPTTALATIEGGRSTAEGGARVATIRGGGAYFEPGAVGGLFVGVYFIQDPDLEEAVEEAIELTLTQRTVFVYGGVIFAAGGNLEFVSCLFWDAHVLLPFSPYIQLGDQVLMLAGTVTMTACMIVEINGFGFENGAGLNIAVLGGALFLNFFNFLEHNFAAGFNAVGESVLVGGGVGIYTGVNFVEASFFLFQTGTGFFTVLGGVQIFTGMNLIEAIGIGAYYGAGMEFTTGAGVTVFTGCNLMDFNGILSQASTGEMSFTGAGVFVAIGTAFHEYSALIQEGGLGNFVFLGAGVATFIGCPLIDVAGIVVWFGNGEFIAQGAGFMVFYGGFFFDVAAIEGFFGLGVFIFIGAGALYIDATSFLHTHALVTVHQEFWVSGSCSPAENRRHLALPSPADVESSKRDDVEGSTREHVETSKRVAQEEEAELGGPGGEIPNYLDGSFGCSYTPEEEEPVAGEEVPARRLNLVDGVNKHTRTRAEFAAPSTRRRQRSATNVLRNVQTQELVLNPAELEKQGMGLYFGPNVKEVTEQDILNSPLVPPQAKQLMSDMIDEVNSLKARVDKHKRKLQHGDDAEGDDDDDDEVRVGRRERALKKKKTKVTTSNVVEPAAPPSPILHVEGTTPGSCNIHLPADKVEGKGVGQCNVHDPKDNSAIVAMTPDEAVEHIDYTPYILVQCDLDVITREGVDVTEEAIHNAAIEATEDWQRAVTDDTIYVQVFDSKPSLPESAMVNLNDLEPFQPHKRSLKENGDYSVTHKFKAVFTITSESVSDALQVSLEDVAAGVLNAYHRANNNTDDGVGDIDLQFERIFSAPAYKEEHIGKGRVRHLGTNTVVLVDAQRPAMPITHIQYDKEYLLHLEQFKPNTLVNVQLLRALGHNVDPEVTRVADIVVDAEGSAQLTYTFKRGTMGIGDYHLQASTPHGGSLSHSPSYTLTHQGAARILFGNSIYL